MMKRVLTVMVIVAGLMAIPAIVLAADDFSATLSGADEVPAVTTTASGSATVNIITDSEVNEINYEVTYSGLSGDLAAAHIHLGAVGANGGILLPLVIGPSPFSGTLKEADLTPTGSVTTFAQAIDAIRAGNTYVNLHTAANPGGEIRGQLKPILNTATEDPVAPAGSPLAVLLAVFAIAAAVAWMRPLARAR
jgi:hypothetical protein